MRVLSISHVKVITHLFTLYMHLYRLLVGGAVASWLARLTPERVVRVRALARDVMLCSWARHFTLIVPLSTQVYKWVPANLMLVVTLRWTSILSRGSRNTPSRFMLQKPGFNLSLLFIFFLTRRSRSTLLKSTKS